MTRILTVTANTAIDLVIEVESLANRDNIQAKQSCEFPCGKGINVAKGIVSQGYPVTCLGFVGQQSLAMFSNINSELLNTDFIPVAGKTRTNLTLNDATANQETHIRTHGYPISRDDCRRLQNKLAGQLNSGDIVILSGSLPAGAADSFYPVLIELCRRKNALTFLDCNGNHLLAGLKASPYLVKPNQQELQEIAQQPLPDEQAIAVAARKLNVQGCEWVYVSRGAKGLIVAGKNTLFTANINSLPDKIISQIGCGDAMLAGLAIGTLKGFDLQKTIQLGIACGTANLFSKEPGKFDNKLAANLLKQIKILEI